jgi:DtxR family Mn-dependent transcriptional regulator
MKVSNTQQDYLKVIWNFEQAGQMPKMKFIADALDVRPPTVLSMLRQLGRIGLVTYDRRQGARLTEKGKLEAESLIRKHRLIETFLQRVLKIEKPLLHDEAEKLEHVMSDQLIMKIDEYLEYPSMDPHGSVIPLSKSDDIPYYLNEMELNIHFKIISIPMYGEEKEFCSKNNILPASKWSISQIGPQGESFLVTNGAHYVAISDHLAEKIKVTIERD